MRSTGLFIPSAQYQPNGLDNNMANLKLNRPKVHLVIPDPHATPGVSNERAEWVGHLICDRRPDTVVCLGDSADMPSLCTYDKGKKSFHGRTYAADIDAHYDFQSRLWGTVRRSKKKMPRRVAFHGNHEQRIARAIETQTELEGVIGYADLELDRFYQEVVPYEGSTPGELSIDGVTYAHYMVSGISGRPISGEHAAHSLLMKRHGSCVVGHSHLLDFCTRTTTGGRKIMGLVAGCYQEHRPEFAGLANDLWWRGVHLLTVQDGAYDVESINISRLRQAYAKR